MSAYLSQVPTVIDIGHYLYKLGFSWSLLLSNICTKIIPGIAHFWAFGLGKALFCFFVFPVPFLWRKPGRFKVERGGTVHI